MSDAPDSDRGGGARGRHELLPAGQVDGGFAPTAFHEIDARECATDETNMLYVKEPAPDTRYRTKHRPTKEGELMHYVSKPRTKDEWLTAMAHSNIGHLSDADAQHVITDKQGKIKKEVEEALGFSEMEHAPSTPKEVADAYNLVKKDFNGGVNTFHDIYRRFETDHGGVCKEIKLPINKEINGQRVGQKVPFHVIRKDKVSDFRAHVLEVQKEGGETLDFEKGKKKVCRAIEEKHGRDAGAAMERFLNLLYRGVPTSELQAAMAAVNANVGAKRPRDEADVARSLGP